VDKFLKLLGSKLPQLKLSISRPISLLLLQLLELSLSSLLGF